MKFKTRRGFIRGLEALIAILMILGSFKVYHWTDISPGSERITKQVLTDVLDSHDELWVYAQDTALLDEFLNKAVPSHLNYKLKLKQFIPVTITPSVTTTNTVHEFIVDFPAGVDNGSIRVYKREYPDVLLPHDAFFNWYRTPFNVVSIDPCARPKKFQLNFPQSHIDSNQDGVLEGIDPQSLDVFFNGEKEEFALGGFTDFKRFDDAEGDGDFNSNLDETESYVNFYSPLPPYALVDGYFYYMTSAQAWPRPARREWTSIASNHYTTGELSQFPPIPLQGHEGLTNDSNREAPEVTSNRAQLFVQMNTTAGEPEHLIVEFGIGTSEEAQPVPSNLTFNHYVESEGTHNITVVSNGHMSVNITDDDEDSDDNVPYSIILDGDEILVANTSIGTVSQVNISTYDLNENAPQAMIRTHMFANGSRARLHRYITVFAERNVTVVSERYTPIKCVFPTLTSLLCDADERLTWLDSIEIDTSDYASISYMLDGALQDEILTGDGPYFLQSGDEPWVELYGGTKGRLGIVFEKPFDNITIALDGTTARITPYYYTPETFKLNWPRFPNFVVNAHVMTKNVMFITASEASGETDIARKLWLEYDGLVEVSYDVDPWVINEGGLPEEESFDFTMFPDSIELGAATLGLNVSATSIAKPTTITCSLNTHTVLDAAPAEAGNIIFVDFDTGWFEDGENDLTCEADDVGVTVTVSNIILKVSTPAAIPRHFGGEWDYARIRFDQISIDDTHEFTFNASKVLNAQTTSQLENVLTDDNSNFDGPAWGDDWNHDLPGSSRSVTEPHNGTRSLKLLVEDDPFTPLPVDEGLFGCSVYTDEGEFYPLTESKTGMISFWYKKEDCDPGTDDNAFLSVIPVNGMGTVMTNSSATLNLTLTDGWVKRSFAFDFSRIPDAEYFLINISLNPNWPIVTKKPKYTPDPGWATLYIDDIDVRMGTAYVLLDETGRRRGVNAYDGGEIGLELEFDGIETRMNYTLLYTDDLTYEHSEFQEGFSEAAESGWDCSAEFCRTIIDSGVWAQKFSRLPPASEAIYRAKTIPAGVNTETAQRVVMNPETGRGSIIMVTAWTKAGGSRG